MWRSHRPHPGDETWMSLSSSIRRLRGVTIASCAFITLSILVDRVKVLENMGFGSIPHAVQSLQFFIPWMHSAVAIALASQVRLALILSPLLIILSLGSLCASSFHFFNNAELTLFTSLDVVSRYVAGYYSIRVTELAFMLFEHQLAWAPISASFDLRKLAPMMNSPSTKLSHQGTVSEGTSNSMSAKTMEAGESSSDFTSTKKISNRVFTERVNERSSVLSCLGTASCTSATCLPSNCSGCATNLVRQLEASLKDPLALLELDTVQPLSMQGMVALKPILRDEDRGIRRIIIESLLWVTFQFVSVMSSQPLTRSVYDSIVQNPNSV